MTESSKTNEVENEHLLPTSAAAEQRMRVLKSNEVFGIFDRFGDVAHDAEGEQGLYYAGTRYLSQCGLTIQGRPLLLLSSHISDDNRVLSVDMTNPEIEELGLHSSNLHFDRSIFLEDRGRFERLVVKNYGTEEVTFSLELNLQADFRDIFEIRGHARIHRGTRLPPSRNETGLLFRYAGGDDIPRFTKVTTKPNPKQVTDTQCKLLVRIPSHETVRVEIEVLVSEMEPPIATTQSFSAGLDFIREKAKLEASISTEVSTSNNRFNALIDRSVADIDMLVTTTVHGDYPYAGIPWFSAPFGRDGIVTALQMLWYRPEIARAVLSFLASTQGRKLDSQTECQPGKIIHEARRGEMAHLHEIPYGEYYGTVDATPLFVVLAGEYLERSADTPFLTSLWPHIELALEWIENFGDSDADGFVEYERMNPDGLLHQGWKDSNNAVFHADGTSAQPPIALCEVQGYVYQAYTAAARIAEALDKPESASKFGAKLLPLKEKFNAAFWNERGGFVALALDGNKKQCEVKSSNMGHCLNAKILSEEQAAKVNEVLMSSAMFSGWGIRTIASDEHLYNPMAYHNGSVWPHDNSIIAAGLAKYGFKDSCVKILTGLFDASNLIDFHRLPELFCGFERQPNRNPTIYPLSCSPQAWAAGSVMMMLGSCLGIKILAQEKIIMFERPLLPDFLKSIVIKRLSIDRDSWVNIRLENHGDDVGVNVTERVGPVQVRVIK